MHNEVPWGKIQSRYSPSEKGHSMKETHLKDNAEVTTTTDMPLLNDSCRWSGEENLPESPGANTPLYVKASCKWEHDNKGPQGSWELRVGLVLEVTTTPTILEVQSVTDNRSSSMRFGEGGLPSKKLSGIPKGISNDRWVSAPRRHNNP